MIKQCSYQEFVESISSAGFALVYREIPQSNISLVESRRCLVKDADVFSIFEMSDRVSVFAFNPQLSLKTFGHKVLVIEGQEGKQLTAPPLTVLRQYYQHYRTSTSHPLARYAGGMLGFMSYDAIRQFEAIPDRHQNTDNIPDFNFKFFRDHLVFDHHNKILLIATAISVGADATIPYQQGLQRLDAIEKRLIKIKPRDNDDYVDKNTLHNAEASVDIDDESFKNAVIKAKQYIQQGDVFQVVLSRCFKKSINVSPFTVYEALKIHSPSPYPFYFQEDNYAIVGASPEKLIMIEAGKVEVCPLAGTRARRKDRDDKLIAAELQSDEKETAEHMMLVDLARNDVGAVSMPGTVKVEELKEAKYFSHVIHLSSTITGELDHKHDIFTALGKAFPAGTLSGAPKIRAMEIIDELEFSRRGMYGGAICLIDSLENLFTCIAIRMAVIKDNIATIRTGAGIVFDSDPQAEANETRAKAASLLKTLAALEGEHHVVTDR